MKNQYLLDEREMAARCIFCDEEDELDNLQQVKQTGLKTLKRLAKERKLENLSRFLFDLQFANLDYINN